ncbi:hypothetical protein BJX76DRAFT_351389 [Aspergillus varians]
MLPCSLGRLSRMDPLAIYAITAGGIFTVLLLLRALSLLASCGHLFSLIVSQHLTLPFVIRRHRFLGPWTRSGVFLHLSYAAINIFLVFFRIKSLTGAGRRAGELALIHHATGWMAVALLLFYIITAVQDQDFTFPLREQRNLVTMLAAISLGVLALHLILWFPQSTSSKIYLLVAVGTCALTLLLELIILLYHNGLFAGRGTPRAIVSFSAIESKEGLVVNAVHIRILLPWRVKVEAGQYINLWMPLISLCSWMQTYPFMVMLWSKGKQDTMELLVRPRNGLTANLLRHASVGAESLILFLALFTGPHGVSEEVSRYDSILVVASGSGIAVVRRLHLVWQVESIDMMTPALALINNLLKDDIMDDGYILHISIYVGDGLKQNGLLFGQYKRVYFYQEAPDYRNIISLEASGDQIERLPNTWDEQGRMIKRCNEATM